MKVQSLDTTKTGLKDSYLEPAGKDTKTQPYSALSMRLAVFRFLADTFDIQDADMRKAAWKQFQATPGWFACNNSACRQALGYKSETEAFEAEFAP